MKKGIFLGHMCIDKALITCLGDKVVATEIFEVQNFRILLYPSFTLLIYSIVLSRKLRSVRILLIKKTLDRIFISAYVINNRVSFHLLLGMWAARLVRTKIYALV